MTLQEILDRVQNVLYQDVDTESGDYEHLIKTFDNYFGCIIDLER